MISKATELPECININVKEPSLKLTRILKQGIIKRYGHGAKLHGNNTISLICGFGETEGRHRRLKDASLLDFVAEKVSWLPVSELGKNLVDCVDFYTSK